mgnify:CR=1 FL=1
MSKARELANLRGTPTDNNILLQSTAGDAWNVACVMEDNPNCPAEEGPDFDHGSSILLVKKTNGDEVLAAGHKDGSVLILDPDNGGELLWSKRLGRGSIQGGVHFGLAAANGAVYVPINDMNDTRNGQFLDPNKARPGVSGIDIDEEAILWQYVQPDNCGDNRPFCDPGVSAPLSVSDGVVYAGHLDGELRAYDVISGRVIWSYDTTQTHTGVTCDVTKFSHSPGPKRSLAAVFASFAIKKYTCYHPQ